MLTISLLFQAVSGVPEEAGMLFPKKHFHGGETETMWSLLIMVWYPVDFTGMNQEVGRPVCYPEKSGQSSL